MRPPQILIGKYLLDWALHKSNEQNGLTAMGYHCIRLHTLHRTIYCLFLFLATSKPPISHLNERRDVMPLLRERRKQALPYISLA